MALGGGRMEGNIPPLASCIRVGYPGTPKYSPTQCAFANLRPTHRHHPPPLPHHLIFPCVCYFRSFLRRLEEKATATTKATGAVSSMASARAMFQAKALRGQAASGGAGKDLWTQHANAIVGMESMGRAGDATCSKLSTCGERC